MSKPESRTSACRIEQTADRRRQGSPRYETFAPDGYRFTSGEHSRLSPTLAGARADAKADLESCPVDCDCHAPGDVNSNSGANASLQFQEDGSRPAPDAPSRPDRPEWEDGTTGGPVAASEVDAAPRVVAICARGHRTIQTQEDDLCATCDAGGELTEIVRHEARKDGDK